MREEQTNKAVCKQMEWLPRIGTVVEILLWAECKFESGDGTHKMYGILFLEY